MSQTSLFLTKAKTAGCFTSPVVSLKEICLLLTFIWTSCLQRVVCGKVLTSITFREKLSGTKYTVSAGNNCVSEESELRCCQRLIDKESGREIKKKEEKVGEN